MTQSPSLDPHRPKCGNFHTFLFFFLTGSLSKKFNTRVIILANILFYIHSQQFFYRTLGIKKIRRLNMSRGGREGNNAFTKDQNVALFDEKVSYDNIMKWNLPISFINKLIKMKKIRKECLVNQHLVQAVRYFRT